MTSADQTNRAFWLDLPWLALSPLLPGPTNISCWRVYALRRSGHHAILNWILAHLPGRHCLLNDCIPGRNPLTSCSKGNSLVKGWSGTHNRLLWKLEQRGWRSKKGHCFHNYENADFRTANSDQLQQEHWLGRSRQSGSILILRDPLNLIASQLRWARGNVLKPSQEQLKALPELWNAYAKEALGLTELLPNLIVIDFNQWFQFQSYRNKIGLQLGFNNRDFSLEHVARFGPTTWGDSFDGTAYEGRASQMKVLERWKQYKNDPEFRKLVAYPDLLGYASKTHPGMRREWINS